MSELVGLVVLVFVLIVVRNCQRRVTGGRRPTALARRRAGVRRERSGKAHADRARRLMRAVRPALKP